MNTFVHNAKVMWIYGGKAFPVQQCHDVHYALARQYVHKHKNDPEYAKGKLIAVSMLKNEFNEKNRRKNKWIKNPSS